MSIAGDYVPNRSMAVHSLFGQVCCWSLLLDELGTLWCCFEYPAALSWLIEDCLCSLQDNDRVLQHLPAAAADMLLTLYKQQAKDKVPIVEQMLQQQGFLPSATKD